MVKKIQHNSGENSKWRFNGFEIPNLTVTAKEEK